jgi:hypothetical protein
MTRDDSPTFAVDRPTESDTDASHRMGLNQLSTDLFDLGQDAGRTFRDIDVAAFKRDEDVPIAGADPELQLGPANFNP